MLLYLQQRMSLTEHSPSQISLIRPMQVFFVFAIGLPTGRLFDAGYFHHCLYRVLASTFSRKRVSLLNFVLSLPGPIFQNFHVITRSTPSLLPEPPIARRGRGHGHGDYVYSGSNYNITLLSREEVHGHGNCDFWRKKNGNHFRIVTDRFIGSSLGV